MSGWPPSLRPGHPADRLVLLAAVIGVVAAGMGFVAGMRGTGSNTLHADAVFVPSHRILDVVAALRHDYATEHSDEVLYRSAFIPVAVVVLAGPQVGMARGVLNTVIEKAPRRNIAYTIFEQQTASTTFHNAVSDAAMHVETAALQTLLFAAMIVASFRELDISKWLLQAARLERGNIERVLERVIADSSDAVLIVDEKLCVLRLSRSARELFELADSVGRGSPLDALVPAEMADAVRAGVAATEMLPAAPAKQEARLVRSDGSVRQTEFTVTPSRLRRLTGGIQSVLEARNVLGPPDRENPTGLTITTPESEDGGPVVSTYPTLTYTRLSDTADVTLVDYGPLGIRFTFQGKFLGKPAPEAV